MLLRKPKFFITAALLATSPALCDELTSDQLERFRSICNVQLPPDEKLSLWLYTGSTTSPEETECMIRMASREMRILENKNYFEQQTSDEHFRTSASISQPSSSSISSIVESTEQMEEKRAQDRAQNEVPITTLRLPGYRSLK